MKRINWLFTFTSLSVLLVTIERFSFTTSIILQPYSYLRLHEVVQMTLIILLTIIIPAFFLKEVSHNFEALKTKKGQIISLLFLIGVYFYATGNGVHEVASYLFNTFCPVNSFKSTLCGSMFFNDYYFGNILYFIGAFLMTVPLILLERMYPNKTFTRKDLPVLVINGIIYAFAIFAYAAFDRVLVGLFYSLITMIVVDILFLSIKGKKLHHPYTLFGVITYTLGTLASLIIRFH